jgi:peptidoglycan/xylan/chitin deacetylase (PgdA/CDA1 family)
MIKFLSAMATLLSLLGLEYKTAFLETYLQGEWRVGKGEVALTFDDCPLEPHTSQILDTLAKYNLKATFFIIGERALIYPNVIRRILNEGHAIGNHGYTDKKPALLSEDRTAQSIIQTQNVLERITGKRPMLFRLPSGIPRRDIKNVIDKEKLRTIFADIFILKERQKEPDEIVSHILSNTKSGSIVLLHGDHNGVVKALPSIISGLKKRGLKFVNLDH